VLKWFNVDLGSDVGLDSIVTPDEADQMGRVDYDFSEPIGNLRAIPSLQDQGMAIYDESGRLLEPGEQPSPKGKYTVRQPLKIVKGGMKPTSLVTLILGELGELPSGDKLVTLFTVFPGFSEPKFRNKQDYVKAGYAFIKPDGTIVTESIMKRWQILAGTIRDY
jgi:hypothetical protein